MSSIEMETMARTYREIQAEIKALEEQADALKQTMIQEMDARDAEALTAGEYTIRWSLYESNRLDSTKLKTEQPDIYAAYAKRTTATRVDTKDDGQSPERTENEHQKTARH
jgi:predicted phage-related endonuclease